jgi:hypothetical protein
VGIKSKATIATPLPTISQEQALWAKKKRWEEEEEEEEEGGRRKQPNTRSTYRCVKGFQVKNFQNPKTVDGNVSGTNEEQESAQELFQERKQGKVQ